MADFIRRLVSGNKARFKDSELGLELDLVYVTDRIIIMGYPASGIEGYYRNKRADAKKFLDHRHGKNYWIFNFCPLGENSYDPKYFEGRVSRYPFPDHHAPPLAIMPLAAREMKAWLNDSPERVAVLHCKAGKGRSGMMACAYLVAVHDEPTPSIVQRSHTEKERVGQRVDETVDAMPDDQDSVTGSSTLASLPSSIDSTSRDEANALTEALKGVLDLHTSRRMKPPSSPSEKQKQGVSIPSQRRFLYYWALCLAHQAPAGFWSLDPTTPPPSLNSSSTKPQKHVRMTEIKIRFRELSNVKAGLLKAANFVIEKRSSKVNINAGSNQVWASLARYDDEFISRLEKWEKYSRDESGRLGVRRPGSEHMYVHGEKEEAEKLAAMFSDGKWDRHKMVRCFGRLGEIGGATGKVQIQEDDMGEKIATYTLRPLTNESWEGIRQDIIDTSSSSEKIPQNETEDLGLPVYESPSTDSPAPRPRTPSRISHDDMSKSPKPNQDQNRGIILNAEREVRIKLYTGQVFMGWIWLIPTFHMPHSPPTMQDPHETVAQTILFSRKEVDFPIGLGAGIIDVEISLEWVVNHP